MKTKKITIRTSRREELIDITDEILQFVRESGVNEGKITVFIPHTTAAVTINENADPTVQRDIIFTLNKLVPKLPDYHHLEGNSDAHVKSSLIGCSQDVFISDGSLVLGTWQGIYFCEFDGPRNRTAVLRID